MSAVPAGQVTTWLRDGRAVHLRPLRRGELQVLNCVFDGLSPRSRQLRYLVAMPRLPATTQRVLTDVDGHHHLGWAAFIHDRPVGICRALRTAPDTVEVAFEVVDAEQGRGIGSALLDAVTTAASARGVHWVEAVTDPGNHASLALLRQLGLVLRLEDGLVEGRGRLRLLARPRVDRRAVLALEPVELRLTRKSIVLPRRWGLRSAPVCRRRSGRAS